jgi:NADPH2:quinone reductase
MLFQVLELPPQTKSQLAILRLIGKSANETRSKLFDYSLTRFDYSLSRDELVTRNFKMVQEGKLKVAVDTCFPFDQAAEGHIYLKAGKSEGKNMI